MRVYQLVGDSGVDALTGLLPSILPPPPPAVAAGVALGCVLEQEVSSAGWGGEVSIAFSRSPFNW